jgi:hypothetical protein
VGGGPVYAWLSATRDGSRLGVSFGNQAYVLDGRGRRVSRAAPAQRRRGAGGADQPRRRAARHDRDGHRDDPAVPGARPVPYLFLGAADGSGRNTVARSTATTGWLGGRLLRDDAAEEAPFQQQLCLLASNTGFACERLVAADPDHELWDPAVSPDGSLVAVTRASLDGFTGDIAIYSAATAQLVRVVSAGASDSGPSWAPDGRSLAFTRGDGGIWVASATGAPGAERRILASASSRCGCAAAGARG